jgi:hypothetical protein
VQEERAAAGRASQATKLSESERELQVATDELQALYLNVEGMKNELKAQEVCCMKLLRSRAMDW